MLAQPSKVITRTFRTLMYMVIRVSVSVRCGMSRRQPRGLPLRPRDPEYSARRSMRRHGVLSSRLGLVRTMRHPAYRIEPVMVLGSVFTSGALSPGIEEAERFLPLNHIRKNGITVLASVPSIVWDRRSFQSDLPDQKSIVPFATMLPHLSEQTPPLLSPRASVPAGHPSDLTVSGK